MHCIPALVIKGFASSVELYNDAFVREYNDLDTLVNLPDVGSAIPVMAGLGNMKKEYRQVQNSNSTERKIVQRGHLKVVCDLVQKLYSSKISPVIESAIFCEPKLNKPVLFAIGQFQIGGKEIQSLKNTLIFRTLYSLPLLRRIKDKMSAFFSPYKIQRMDIDVTTFPRQLYYPCIPKTIFRSVAQAGTTPGKTSSAT